MKRHPHVLNAASNLLGISFVLIGALRYTNSNSLSYADEAAWLSSLCFLVSIVSSYWAIRNNDDGPRMNIIADGAFFSGLFLLFLSMLMVGMIL